VIDSVIPLTRSTRSEKIKRGAIRALLGSTLRAAYRLRVRGMQHVPERGPALVVCNHVSFIDWLFIGVALPRLPHFVMHQHHWRSRAFRWFFDLHRVIPIAPRKEDPARLDAAMRAIDAALDAGELVMIFPEGDMTHDGELGPLRPGLERIIARRPVPVLPVALRGLWGSFFSRKEGEPMKKIPRRRRATVEVVAGPALPADVVSLDHVATCLTALRGAAR